MNIKHFIKPAGGVCADLRRPADPGAGARRRCHAAAWAATLGGTLGDGLGSIGGSGQGNIGGTLGGSLDAGDTLRRHTSGAVDRTRETGGRVRDRATSTRDTVAGTAIVGRVFRAGGQVSGAANGAASAASQWNRRQRRTPPAMPRALQTASRSTRRRGNVAGDIAGSSHAECKPQRGSAQRQCRCGRRSRRLADASGTRRLRARRSSQPPISLAGPGQRERQRQCQTPMRR